MTGDNEREAVNIDMAAETVVDLRTNISRAVYNPDFAKLRGDLFAKTVPNYLSQLESFMGEKQWLAVNHVSYADFFAYETLSVIRAMEGPAALEPYPNLRRLMHNFEAIPNIAAYLKSPQYKAVADSWNGLSASWGAAKAQ